jgi:hypothetical protein
MRLNRVGYKLDQVGSVIRIAGVTKFFTNLNREIEGIQGRSQVGLNKAAALIRNETEHGGVKTPVDLGNLRASWFTVSANSKIVSGGGVSHTSTGQESKFDGPKAGSLAAGHASILTEMKAKTQVLSNTYDGPFLIMGYSANYAMWVHENINPGIHFKRKGAGPKWFEAAIKNQRDNIIKVIRDNAKIKK